MLIFYISVILLLEIDISGSEIFGDKVYGIKKIITNITKHNAEYTILQREKVTLTLGLQFWFLQRTSYCLMLFYKIETFRIVAIRYDILIS